MIRVKLKRVYEPVAAEDGLRVLVDRVWPRGLTRAQVAADHWLKEVAPSTALRQWFAHDPKRWDGFIDRYHRELDANPAVAALRDLVRTHPGVTLLYAARDPLHNQAVALERYLTQQATSG